MSATDGRGAVYQKIGSRRKRRNRWRKLASRYMGYLFGRIALAILSQLPLGLGLALSRVGGHIVYFVSRRDRLIAYDNLRNVYGHEWSEQQLKQCIVETFQHNIATLVEALILARWSNEQLMAKYPEAIAGVLQLERKTRESENGLLLLTGHYGNWEMIPFLAHRFANSFVVSIAQKLYFPKYQELLHRFRTREGMEVIYSDESPRRLMRAMRNGKCVGLLPDRTVRTNRGIFVDFFGRPVYTTTLPIRLARKIGAQVQLISLVREPESLLSTRQHRFRVDLPPLLELEHTGNEERDLRNDTQKFTWLIEEAIRNNPSQWSWSYPRWRAVPGRPRLPHGARSPCA